MPGLDLDLLLLSAEGTMRCTPTKVGSPKVARETGMGKLVEVDPV